MHGFLIKNATCAADTPATPVNTSGLNFKASNSNLVSLIRSSFANPVSPELIVVKHLCGIL